MSAPKTPPPNRLKPKTKKMIELIDNEHMSQREAYKITHPNASTATADANSSKILNSTNVIIYRKEHVLLAKKTIVDIMSDSTVKPDTRIKAAVDVLDRTQGKAVQRSEVKTANLNLNVQASQELSDSFSEWLRQQTREE